MKFLVDNQLPAALARLLASRGVDCRHVLDLDLGEATDSEMWNHATAHDCIVISKDEDFLYLANSPSATTRLVWVRIGNCRTSVLLSTFENLWPKIEASLKAGDRVIEIR